MGEGIIGKSSQAAKSAFSSIDEIEGILQAPTRIKNKFGEFDDNGKVRPDQAEIKLTDALILKMEEGVEEPELKDGVFTTWINYAPPGKDPSGRSFFVKGFLKSGEALDAKRRSVDIKEGDIANVYGTRVRLVKATIELFTPKPKPGSDEVPEVVSATNFIVDELGGSAEDIGDHILKLVDGKNIPMATKALMMDARAKRNTQYKDAISNGSLDKLLPVTLDKEGVFHAVTNTPN